MPKSSKLSKAFFSDRCPAGVRWRIGIV